MCDNNPVLIIDVDLSWTLPTGSPLFVCKCCCFVNYQLEVHVHVLYFHFHGYHAFLELLAICLPFSEHAIGKMNVLVIDIVTRECILCNFSAQSIFPCTAQFEAVYWSIDMFRLVFRN